MNELPESRLDDSVAERLLSGDFGIDPDLGELLSAAAEPAEVSPAGLATTLAAFERATRGVTPHRAPRRFEVIRKSLAASVTAKLAAVAAGVLVATGGAALAAGKLPATGHQSRPSHAPSHTASPSPNFVGLCTAVEAGALEGGEGKAADSPAFSALIDTAGGEENLAAYCSELLGEPAAPSSEDPEGETPETDEETPGNGQATADAHRPDKSETTGHPEHPVHPSQAQGPKDDHPGQHGRDHRPDTAGPQHELPEQAQRH